MSRLNPSFVLGYHGCDRAIGERVLAGELRLLRSDHDYDWLGPGVYFWESDPVRAQEWAESKVARKEFADPFVVGAVIDLRNCLDLTVRDDLDLVKAAYDAFKEDQEANGLPMPQNENLGRDENSDQLLRYLDCAVIRHLHGIIENQPADSEIGFIEPFDTVRGLFPEGAPLFSGSGFMGRTHAQIAVRTDDCVIGVFRLRTR